MNASNKIYWDSCVLIEWLQNTQEKRHKLTQAVMDELDREDSSYSLVLSMLIYVEVIGDSKEMSSESMDELELFIHNPRVRLVVVDDEIAKKAGELRMSLKPKKLTAPDAIHLATAIIRGVDTLHTFDNDLLRLNGNPIAEGVKISECKLPGGQLTLPA
ncbi:MAG: type II toxin-antitoxin system VapC family toxin [Gammaproteobacteria bacterium AqS3]|nr:type II toxin-antitoxin system VapC family toxin [Gammaproteobacteria bacterium AqS3]